MRFKLTGGIGIGIGEGRMFSWCGGCIFGRNYGINAMLIMAMRENKVENSAGRVLVFR